MTQHYKVWDWPVRLVHWLLVILVAAAWWTAENDIMDWHYRAGYTLLALLVFRLVWGVVGSTTAKFSHFIRSPQRVWQYCQSLWQRQPAPSVGHNPLGGWSSLLLLFLLLTQIGLGLIAEGTDGLSYGPLSSWVSYDTARWAAETHHELWFNLLLAFIALHIAAVAFYLLYKKDNLVTPMITGNKLLGAPPALQFRPWWLALGLLIIAGAGVYWLVA